jgi:structural maintenance of chromosome 2
LSLQQINLAKDIAAQSGGQAWFPLEHID